MSDSLHSTRTHSAPGPAVMPQINWLGETMDSTRPVILVGSSLEVGSDPVVRTALDLSRQLEGRLIFFHAHSLPVAFFAGPSGMTTISPGLLEAERNLRERMVDVQLKRLGASRSDLEEVVVQAGAPHRSLLEATTESQVDLIVLGANEHPERFWQGSTADRVLRKATCPVWIVHGRGGGLPRRILAPTDLSALSEESLVRGLSLVASLGVEGDPIDLLTLFVLTQEERGSSTQFDGDQIERLAKEELDRFTGRFQDQEGFHVSGGVRVGNVRQEILAELEDTEADLMIMGTHGRSGFERFLLGSVAADLAGRSPQDVLIVPPGEAMEGGDET